MNQNKPLTRHSREGGNPAKQTLREADKSSVLSRYAGLFNHLDSRRSLPSNVVIGGGNDAVFALMDNQI
jgi:hypothetical protein